MDDRAMVEIECNRLVVAYTHLVDGGRAAEVADLFAEDGVWSSPEQRMEGREEIRAGFARRQAMAERTSRHVCTNLAVHPIDSENATGLVYLTLYRHDGEGTGRAVPVLVGGYHDTFRLTSEGWRFAERRTEVVFAGRS